MCSLIVIAIIFLFRLLTITGVIACDCWFLTRYPRFLAWQSWLLSGKFRRSSFFRSLNYWTWLSDRDRGCFFFHWLQIVRVNWVVQFSRFNFCWSRLCRTHNRYLRLFWLLKLQLVDWWLSFKCARRRSEHGLVLLIFWLVGLVLLSHYSCKLSLLDCFIRKSFPLLHRLIIKLNSLLRVQLLLLTTLLSFFFLLLELHQFFLLLEGLLGCRFTDLCITFRFLCSHCFLDLIK